jgi:hypothetical protein
MLFLLAITFTPKKRTMTKHQHLLPAYRLSAGDFSVLPPPLSFYCKSTTYVYLDVFGYQAGVGKSRFGAGCGRSMLLCGIGEVCGLCGAKKKCKS